MNKKVLYKELVAKRKADRSMAAHGYKNQSDFPEYDSDEIGNYSTWANDLDADLMVIAQDYCNQKVFERDQGKIQLKPLNDPETKCQWDTETNYFLWKLLKSIGKDIGTPDSPKKAGVFLTNAVLGLKDAERMNDPVPKKVFDHDGQHYLKPLIEIVQPKKVITLGKGAAQALLSLYADESTEAKKFKEQSMTQIFRHGSFDLSDFTLFPMFHPSALGQNGRKRIHSDKKKDRFELMVVDWKKI